MKPGTLIVIGVFALVVGLIPPLSALCVVSGLFCMFMGINGLNHESQKEEQNGPEDGDKEGPV